MPVPREAIDAVLRPKQGEWPTRSEFDGWVSEGIKRHQLLDFVPVAFSRNLVPSGTFDEYPTLDVESEEGRAVMEFLRSPEVSDGGLIGWMVPLVERAVTFAEAYNQPMGIKALRLAHAMSTASRRMATTIEVS